MTNERRQVRSTEPKTALYLYLARLAQCAGLAALVLATSEGLLVTGTSSQDVRVDLETLAAVSPVVCGDVEANLADFDVRASEVSATRVSVDGEPFYLAAVGGAAPQQDVSTALQRIFG